MPQFALLSARACGLRAAAGAAAAAGVAAAGAGVATETDAAGAVEGAGALADAAAVFGVVPAATAAVDVDAGAAPGAGGVADDAAVRGADDAWGDAAVRPGAEVPARRALAGCISDASPPVDHWGDFDCVRTFVGGSSMGSSNCSDSESLVAETFEPDAGAGSGPHPENSAISAMKAPERRHPEHGPAAFIEGCRGGA